MGLFNRVKYDEQSINVCYFERLFDIDEISQQLNFFQEAVNVYGLGLGNELENFFLDDSGKYRQQVEGGGELSIEYNVCDDSSFITFYMKLPQSENSNNQNTLNQIFFILAMLLDKWGDTVGAFKHAGSHDDWHWKFQSLVTDDFRESVGKYIYGDEW